MLLKPFLAECKNRKLPAKQHPTAGSPEEWYSNELLAGKNLFAVSFDFFVNWSAAPPALTPFVWIKRILKAGYTYQQLADNLYNALVDEFGLLYLKRLLQFCKNNSLAAQFIIFSDDNKWDDDSSGLLMADAVIDGHENIQLHSAIVNIEYFKKLIQQHSGGPVAVGAKGLTYGTSCLECFLSHTNSAYPGDADLVLLNDENKAAAVLEFKKHNLSSPVSEQKLSNWYPVPDKRKYDRLAILCKYLSSQNNSIPLLNIYYPTKSDFTEGAMEIVTGSTGSLKSEAVSKFLLPVNNAGEGCIEVIEKTLKATAYYNRISRKK